MSHIISHQGTYKYTNHRQRIDKKVNIEISYQKLIGSIHESTTRCHVDVNNPLQWRFGVGHSTSIKHTVSIVNRDESKTSL